jgi:hypothetical protein
MEPSTGSPCAMPVMAVALKVSFSVFSLSARSLASLSAFSLSLFSLSAFSGAADGIGAAELDGAAAAPFESLSSQAPVPKAATLTASANIRLIRSA